MIIEDTSTYTVKSKEDVFEVSLNLKANTLKDGEQLTATHILYYEEAQENEIGREDDLTNKDQTVTFKTPEQPKKPEEKQSEKKEEVPQELPKTGSVQTMLGVIFGGSLVILVALIWFNKFKGSHV